MADKARPDSLDAVSLKATAERSKSPGEIHVSSLVIHCRPEYAASVADALSSQPGVEIHGGVGEGKLVVTLETTTESEIVDQLAAIQVFEGVLAAALVFHHSEPMHEEGSHGPIPT